MVRASLVCLFLVGLVLYRDIGASTCAPQSRFVAAVHGGAGGWHVSAAEKERAQKKIEEALLSAYARLKQGESSLDAV